MVKLVDMANLQIPCLHCQQNRRINPMRPFDPCEHCGAESRQVTNDEPSIDIRELQAAHSKAKEADQERLTVAIALYRRNAGIEEWNELNLDRDEWLLKFKYMGLDEILARGAERV